MLIFLIDSNVNDGKQVSDHLAGGSGEYMWMPDTNDLIVASRCDHVGVGAESETIDTLWYTQGLTRAVNMKKKWNDLIILILVFTQTPMCVRTVYSVISPESCEQISQAYYSGGI